MARTTGTWRWHKTFRNKSQFFLPASVTLHAEDEETHAAFKLVKEAIEAHNSLHIWHPPHVPFVENKLAGSDSYEISQERGRSLWRQPHVKE